MNVIKANSISVSELEEKCKEQGISLVIEDGKVTGAIREDFNVQTA